MLVDHISKNAVCFDFDCETREQAIEKAVGLLVDGGNATTAYVSEVLTAFAEYGPYIVMTPHVALPHSRPSEAILKSGVSFLKLARPVVFGHPDNDPVSFVLALCGQSSDGHLELLADLAEFLSMDNLLDKLEGVETFEDLAKVK